MSHKKQKSMGIGPTARMDYTTPAIGNRRLISDYYLSRSQQKRPQPEPPSQKQLMRDKRQNQIAEHIRSGRSDTWIETELNCSRTLIEETKGDMMLGKFGGYG